MFVLVCDGPIPLSAGESIVGRKDPSSEPAIVLSGLSIQKSHAIFVNDGNSVIIKPGVVGAKTKVLDS